MASDFFKLCFVDNFDSKLLRLFKLAASRLARDNERGFRGNRALTFSAALFDKFLRLATLKVLKRARQNHELPREYPLIIFIFSVLFVIEINLLIRKLNEAYDKLSYTAMHDSLTGLYNRHSLRDFFESLTESGNEYCVALGDIDNFKKVNDTYGHDCGDEVLVTVSDIIKESIAEQDLACRWGGEEILIIMRGTRNDCLDRMNSIRSRINASVVKSGNSSVKVTMTFGFADCHEVENSEKNRMDSIVILVDGRLYKGKNSGKNVIVSEEIPVK